VQAVDFAAARHLFAEDFVAFGTFTQARATSGSRLCLRVRYWFNPVTYISEGVAWQRRRKLRGHRDGQP